jgi:hypothetical protein
MANSRHIDAVLDGNRAIRKILLTEESATLDLSNADFSGKDLKKRYLGAANLKGANLSNSDLSDSDLSGANLTGANLKNTYCHGAQFVLTNFTDADLTDCDLDESNLSGAKIDANLKGASLRKCNLNRTEVTQSIEEANTSKSFTEYKGIRTPGTHIWLKIPFGVVKLLLSRADSNFKRSNRFFMEMLPWALRFYAYLFLAPFKVFTWPLSGKLGRLTFLTKASYLSLVIVPILAWLWPAVRAAVNDYNVAIVESARQASQTAEKLAELAQKVETTVLPDNIKVLILDLHHQVSSVAASLSEEIVRSPNLPISLVAAFLAALAVVAAHLVLESFGPEIVRNFSQENYRQTKEREWSKASANVRNETFKERFQYLRDTADANQDKYHKQLIEHYGRLIWLPNKLDSNLLIPEERQESIIGMAAKREYEIAALSMRFFSFLSGVLYVFGLFMIGLIVVIQTNTVINQSGLL